MIQKPRRNWWFLPGGKVEQNETWEEAVIREVQEETGLLVSELRLRGSHMLQIESETKQQAKIQTIIQFTAGKVEGKCLTKSKEGLVSTIAPHELFDLRMDSGDRFMILHTLHATKLDTPRVYYGRFTYTFEHQLTCHSITPRVPIAELMEL